MVNRFIDWIERYDTEKQVALTGSHCKSNKQKAVVVHFSCGNKGDYLVNTDTGNNVFRVFAFKHYRFLLLVESLREEDRDGCQIITKTVSWPLK